MAKRFVLRYRHPGQIPDEQLSSIDRLEGVRILDRSPRMLLVDGDEATLQAFVESIPGWVLLPGDIKQYQLPDPRPRPRKLE